MMEAEEKRYTESDLRCGQEFIAFLWRCRVAELEEKIIEMCRQLRGEKK